MRGIATNQSRNDIYEPGLVKQKYKITAQSDAKFAAKSQRYKNGHNNVATIQSMDNMTLDQNASCSSANQLIQPAANGTPANQGNAKHLHLNLLKGKQKSHFDS